MKGINLCVSKQDTINNINEIKKILTRNGKDLKGFNFETTCNNEKILLLGGPQIKGSLSPFIHNYSAYIAGKIKYEYLLFDIEKSGSYIEKILVDMQEDLNIAGANVTMPYKSYAYEILKQQNQLDTSSLRVGAVNTIVRENGKLIGYNTDVEGIKGPILDKLNDLTSINNGYILGAGGAAKAVIVGLYELGIKSITIFNRSDITDLILHFDKTDCKDLEINYVNYDVNGNEQISDYITKKGILVNTLPFGLKSNAPKRSIRLDEIDKIKDKISLFFDIVYDMSHGDTPMLGDFKELNIVTCEGRDMLIGQALKGFELWTHGKKIDKNIINGLLI